MDNIAHRQNGEIEDSVQPDGRWEIARIAGVLAAHTPRTHRSKKAPRRAAVAMILSEASDGCVRTLFIKRSEHPLDPWSGHMAFPGGHQDPGDATLEAAAIRETLEEVGIDMRPEMIIGRLHDMNGSRRVPYELTVSPFVFHYPHTTELKLNSEVADAVWVPLEYLADPRSIQPYLYPPDPERRNFPSFQYEGRYTIWGMTFRMVGHFMELFGIKLPTDEPLTDVELGKRKD